MSLLDNLTARLPFGQKTQESEYFFSLNIGLSLVSASLWSLTGKNLEILGTSTMPYSDTEDLIDKANRALEKALGAFELEPEKILFGVPDGWLMDDNLKEPYLKLLRTMLKEYGLEPLAYVATSHALSHFVHKHEGVPLSAVLVEVGDFVVVTVVQAGKIIGTKAAKHTDQLFADVEKAINGISGVENLPSKILLYSADQTTSLTRLKESLLSYPWVQKLPFLHLPKIETLPATTINDALVYAGASEMLPDVSPAISYAGAGSQSPIARVESLLSNAADAAGLGFVTGDVLNQEKPAPAEPSKEDDNLRDPEGPLFEEEEPPLRHQPAVRAPMEVMAPIEEEFVQVENKLTPYFAKIQRFIPTSLSHSKFANRRLLIPLGVIVLLAVAYLLLIKAEVTILVDPKILEKDAQVIADPKVKSVDEANKIIPGTIVETSVTGTAQGTATGQKAIGNAAKGTVILYNQTSNSVSVPSGTTLTSDKGVKYKLDSGVQLPAQSVSTGSAFQKITTPGKSDPVNATAVAIGPESNLAPLANLTVGNYAQADVVAQNDSAFAGGTSKNVTVVTADDQKKLQAQVTADLKKKASDELQGKLQAGQKVPVDALSVTDSKFVFNKSVNDQATEFTVNATLKVKGTAYVDTDLKTILGKMVETTVPDGYVLNLQETETQADISSVDKDGKITFLAKFRAKLLPNLGTDELKGRLRGRSVGEVAEIVKGLENAVGSEVKTSPNLPSALVRMPLLIKNITIKVSPK